MLKCLSSHLSFMEYLYVVRPCPASQEIMQNRVFSQHVSCIALLMLCTQLFDPYHILICGLVWWLTKMNLMFFQGVGSDAYTHCPVFPLSSGSLRSLITIICSCVWNSAKYPCKLKSATEQLITDSQTTVCQFL